jgi:hypothetical protein
MYHFKVSNMKKADPVAYDAESIWGAAVYATRINLGYNKEDLWSMDPDTHTVEEEPHTVANRTLAKQALAEGLITAEDRTKGVEIRNFLSGRLTIKALTKKLNDFEQSLAKAVSLDDFVVPQDRMLVGIVNSQIVKYNTILKEEAITADSVYGTYGKVKERLDVELIPSSRFWLTDWGTFCYNSITLEGYKTSFFYKNKLEIGKAVKVSGTVKKHTDNVTTINRVKVKDQNGK